MIARILQRGPRRGPGALLQVSAWIAEHGLPFAACAAAETAGVNTGWGRLGANSYGSYCVRTGHDGHGWQTHSGIGMAMRQVLAAASEEDYRKAVDRLADHRRTPFLRATVSFLVPRRGDWVDECCAEPPRGTADEENNARQLLWCAVGSADQLARLGPWADLPPRSCEPWLLWTALGGVGPDIAPFLARALDGLGAKDQSRKWLPDILGRLPTDEAFELMAARLDQNRVIPAAKRMIVRFPVRAVRVLARASKRSSVSAGIAGDLLEWHARERPELVDALPDDARAALEEFQRLRGPEVPEEELPKPLAAPPWTSGRKASKPVVVDGLKVPGVQELVWAPGERDEWAAWMPREEDRWLAFARWGFDFHADWEAYIKEAREAGKDVRLAPGLFIHGDEKLVRPLLADWAPKDSSMTQHWMRPVVARFGLEVRPHALHAAQAHVATRAALLLPYLDGEVASLMAYWLADLKSARAVARAWFVRHGVNAAPLLAPAALGKPGKARRQAEAALRFLASRTGPGETMAAVRDVHGEKAASAVESLLAADPLDIVPARLPKIGDWAMPEALPQVLLRGRERSLPLSARGHLLTMLSISKPGEEYAGLDVAREVCDPESLAAFAWSVFLRWRLGDAPAKEGWALTALELLGDDETVRRLAPVIRAWARAGGHKQAVNGLDVLTAIGTDTALIQLSGIAQGAKSKSLRSRAQEKIADVARERGLTHEQLADRLVPDFGLDAAGGLLLDYGTRRFRVGFDENLVPFVTDADGKPRKSLPKPGANDDKELAPTAYKRFTALKKDVRTAAFQQVRRLEGAMLSGRRWTAAEFRGLLVDHPFLWHLTRRLVWTSGGTTFRVAEDRTFADLNDDVFVLSEDAEVCIPHPARWGEPLTAWSDVFADYAIVQPFPQLGRPVHVLAEAERAADRLDRFEGGQVPAGSLLGLNSGGWERGAPEDNGVFRTFSRPTSTGAHVVITIDPGIPVGRSGPDQRVTGVTISAHPHGAPGGPRFGDLDPVTASELLTTLTALTEAT
ncbi:hypothetical protein GCM10010191_27080 [Actinomadura vinacea]|uniref:DUF4132 domain-containing protein n=1 Tax=Actinomadura vinacea TaxID=115336 RepID=A0ABN3IXQ7_9ACTN